MKNESKFYVFKPKSLFKHTLLGTREFNILLKWNEMKCYKCNGSLVEIIPKRRCSTPVQNHPLEVNLFHHLQNLAERSHFMLLTFLSCEWRSSHLKKQNSYDTGFIHDLLIGTILFRGFIAHQMNNRNTRLYICQWPLPNIPWNWTRYRENLRETNDEWHFFSAISRSTAAGSFLFQIFNSYSFSTTFTLQLDSQALNFGKPQHWAKILDWVFS